VRENLIYFSKGQNLVIPKTSANKKTLTGVVQALILLLGCKILPKKRQIFVLLREENP
jgi:hypothetical protein